MEGKDGVSLGNICQYGAMVKAYRKEHRVSSVKEFADLIWRRTRTAISKDALYRIEQGRQLPSAEQFMAINLALYGRVFPDEVRELLRER